MKDAYSPHGRRLERRHSVERVFDDETGVDITAERSREILENPDGDLEVIEHVPHRLLTCGHPWRQGDFIAVCEDCTGKARETRFVCKRCARQCKRCGKSLCVRHTRPAPNGKAFCPRCYMKAKREGLFCDPADANECACVPEKSFIAKLLEWW